MKTASKNTLFLFNLYIRISYSKICSKFSELQVFLLKINDDKYFPKFIMLLHSFHRTETLSSNGKLIDKNRVKKILYLGGTLTS